MELQDDGSYEQVDYIVGYCENCDHYLCDNDKVYEWTINRETWATYECPRCGHNTSL